GGVVGAGAVVAGGAQAAERHVARRARGRTVEVHHARADAVDEAVPELGVVADQTGGQAVFGGVGGGDGGVEGRHADDLEEGGEHLLVLDGDAGDVDDRGLHKRAGKVVDGAGGADDLGARVDALLQGRKGGGRRLFRDQRAGVGLRVAVPRRE
uniref:Nitrite reductase n=1 Tax=Parastrongyloides trichosuri TaxID=131310 RepID=A0A0N4Z5J5_PARTI